MLKVHNQKQMFCLIQREKDQVVVLLNYMNVLIIETWTQSLQFDENPQKSCSLENYIILKLFTLIQNKRISFLVKITNQKKDTTKVIYHKLQIELYQFQNFRLKNDLYISQQVLYLDIELFRQETLAILNKKERGQQCQRIIELIFHQEFFQWEILHLAIGKYNDGEHSQSRKLESIKGIDT
ncbi:unnamed protein product [Paramecium octaurelia]|uniref:Uncharacterized protein n=1 Tax=Paramecium octaurelia TaxID=43137 RepID=A0A8S1TLX6_PAROT|nr:unnamed protein product [Paramecium octaurelia]